MTITVYGTLLDPDGTPQAGRVLFNLLGTIVTEDGVVTPGQVGEDLDEAGYFSKLLQTPLSGTAPYDITYPTGEHLGAYLATGTDVDIRVLQAVASTAADPDELQDLVALAEQFEITEVSAGPYTVLATDEYVRCTDAFAVTLPAAIGSGRVIVVKNISIGTVAVTADGSDLIDGLATKNLYPHGSASFIDAGSGSWDYIGAYYE